MQASFLLKLDCPSVVSFKLWFYIFNNDTPNSGHQAPTRFMFNADVPHWMFLGGRQAAECGCLLQCFSSLGGISKTVSV